MNSLLEKFEGNFLRSVFRCAYMHVLVRVKVYEEHSQICELIWTVAAYMAAVNTVCCINFAY